MFLSDCDDDGCTYTETLVIALPSNAFSKTRVGHKVGIRLYGDRYPTTVWLPAGYVGGFFTATTERRDPKQSAAERHAAQQIAKYNRDAYESMISEMRKAGQLNAGRVAAASPAVAASVR